MKTGIKKDVLRLTQVTQRSLGDVLSLNDRHCEFVRKLLFHLLHNNH